MVKKILLILFLLFSSLTLAQSISASASVDSTTYLVGDYINYKVQVNYDKSIKLVTPFIQDSLKNVDIIKTFKSIEPTHYFLQNAFLFSLI